MLGAQLQAATLDAVLFTSPKRGTNSASFTWQSSPDAVPAVAIVPLSDCRILSLAESFGIFPTERKARNALVRLAKKQRLCHCLLGISEFATDGCRACPIDQPGVGCVGRINRTKELVRLFAALRPLRLPAWPHRGAVGIRERSDMHVVDHWRYLGTAQSESDLHGLLESRPPGFDRRLYRLLNRTFSRLPQSKIVDLYQYGYCLDRAAAIPTDIDN
jgi:DNA polymerase-3 subunit epsilon